MRSAGCAFFKEYVAGLRDDLFAVLREPEAVFEGKSLQRNDAIESQPRWFRREWDRLARLGLGRAS